MLRTSRPADGVVSIEINPSAAVVLVKNLQTIVVDEQIGRASLELVS